MASAAAARSCAAASASALVAGGASAAAALASLARVSACLFYFIIEPTRESSRDEPSRSVDKFEDHMLGCKSSPPTRTRLWHDPLVEV